MLAIILSINLCAANEPVRAEYQVGDLTREALVCAPSDTTSAAPLVFVFHGHGGNMKQSARSFHLHELWPEAIVVYPQGVPTATPVDPQGKQPGWQRDPGAVDDRDLKFFDVMLKELSARYQIDARRIYATGHSNGAVFTYLLWAKRPDVLAAVAPCAAPRTQAGPLRPLPAMHIAGKADKIAPFAAQERTMNEVRRVDGCDEQGANWAKDCTLYPSKTGTPFVALIHDGGHIVPAGAPELMVRLFKEHQRVAAYQSPR